MTELEEAIRLRARLREITAEAYRQERLLKDRKERAERRAKGLCSRCGERVAPAGKMCTECRALKRLKYGSTNPKGPYREATTVRSNARHSLAT